MEKRLASFIACLLVSIGMTFAQNEASGTVIFADDGEPVIGASVIVLGGEGGIGVATDIDGKFKLSVPKGAKLKISYVGMETQTLPAAKNRPSVNKI